MLNKNSENIHPLHLKAPSGKIFVTVYTPATQADHWVLHFPAFAEEMNKSRPMISQMARKCNSANYTVLVPDLFGSGDSGGDFSDTTWGMWLADMHYLLQWAIEQGAEKITLWGLRVGCLLAANLWTSLDDNVRAKVERLLFWQPVLNGEQFSTQFLRLRVAASMMSGEKITVGGLRKELQQEGRLEVAGYFLNAHLIEELDQQSLKHLMPDPGLVVNWFEVASTKDKPINMGSHKLIDQWKNLGACAEGVVVKGEPFWTTQEVVLAPELIRSSMTCIDRDLAGVSLAADKDLSTLNTLQSDVSERGVIFDCQGQRLVGIAHHSARPNTRGVLMVVGGPQYRIGSHRQFLLLARDLAESGIPVFRFDYRGMGDSEGVLAGFEHIQQDIRSAIDCFQIQIPGIKEVVLWGLCDAASASAFYASSDSRIAGLVLLNPWVRSEQGEAKAFIKHYYLRRLLSKAFWQKVLKGDFLVGKSISSLLFNVRRVNHLSSGDDDHSTVVDRPLGTRVYSGLSLFKGKVLLILSGNDLTAAEFKDEVNLSRKFKALLKQDRFQNDNLQEADHTFSRKTWRDQVSSKTIEWFNSW